MPKQIWKIDEFHGGINDNADPRDILNNELAVAENVAVNELGKIKMLGGQAATNGGNSPSDAEIHDDTAGYGLFTFNSDFTGANTGTPANTPTSYIAVADVNDAGTGSDTEVDVAAEGGAFTPSKVKLEIATNAGDENAPVDFYHVDGALRVSDTDFTHTANTPMYYRFFGDINRANLDAAMMESAVTSQAIASDWYSIRGTKIEAPGTSTFEPDETQSIAANDSIQAGSSGAPLFLLSSAVATDGDGTTSTGMVAYGTLTGASVDNLRRVVVDVEVNTGDEGNTGQWGYKIEVFQLSGTSADRTSLTAKATLTDQYGRGSTTRQHTLNVNADGSATSVGSTNNWKIVVTCLQIDNEVEDISVLSVTWADSGASYIDHSAVLKTSTNNFHVALDQPTNPLDEGFGWGADWQVGMSLIYDGNQESLITTCGKKSSPETKFFNYTSANGGKSPNVAIFCAYNTGSGNWNKRITGAVMYMKKLTDKQWYPQIEMDFVKGMGKALFSEVERPVISQNVSSQVSYVFQFKSEDLLEPQLAMTYESRTGISHKEKSIHSLWKTSCLANRRIYIANVKTFYEDGTTKIFPDKMIRSLPNRFDIFPLSESVDVAVNDGESIVALVPFNDRILQFKEKTLYIINASQDVEFLEDTLDYRGISHRASVFKTEYGVVWANKNGCYHYDGQRVHDLLLKDGRPLIKQKTWEDFMTIPLVGYSPRHKQVIVVDDISDNKNGSCYIYDMITRSWTKGGAATFPDTNKSNFAIDSDGKLILHSHTSTTSLLKEWTGVATQTLPKIVTKDIDFGSPSQKKSVKKVYISFRGDASDIEIYYGIDGVEPSSLTFNKITGATDGSSANTDHSTASKCIPFNAGTTDWLCAELKPSAGSVTCNSFRITIDGTAATDFEINDISVVYRPKSVK